MVETEHDTANLNVDIREDAATLATEPRIEAAGRKTKSKQSWSASIDDADRYGFYKLKNAPLRTMDERQYEEILANDPKWAELRTRMDADFNHALEMFPYAERGEKKVVTSENWIERTSQWLGDTLKTQARRRKLTNIELPQRYYSITRMDIEERFPGGRASGEPGDGDIRDMLAAFRQLFRENLAHYIYKKRQYQFRAVCAFAAATAIFLMVRPFVEGIAFDKMKGFLPGLDLIWASLLTAVLLFALTIAFYRGILFYYKDRSQIIFDSYNNTQTESCKTLDKQAALRSKNLFNLIATMASRVDKDEATLDQEIRFEVWPERAYRWTMVVYWLGRRLENLERYTQLQMWLVRRTHYFYRLVATSSNHAVNYLNGLVIFAFAFLVWLFANPASHFRILYATFIQSPWQWLCRQAHSMSVQMGFDWRLARFSEVEFIPFAWVRTIKQTYAGLTASSDPLHFLWQMGVGSTGALIVLLPCLFAYVMAWRLLQRVSYLSARDWNTSLEMIGQNMDIRNWDRFHSVHLPHLLASQVRSDKNNILRRESWVAGKNR